VDAHTINVEVVSATGTYKAEIPEEMKVSEIVAELSLYFYGSGAGDNHYGLLLDNSDQKLSEDMTLIEAGVKGGDKLLLSLGDLVSEVKAEEGNDQTKRKGSNQNSINVDVIFGNGLAESLELDLDTEVGSLVVYLREMFELPEHSYVLDSKELGRQLNPTTTLRRAEIREGFHLYLRRSVVAGGAPPGIRALRTSEGKSSLEYPATLPNEVQRFLRHLEEWALANKRDARIDTLKFWSFKLPAIIGAGIAGITGNIHTSPAVLSVIGLLSAVFIALDGIVRPGRLHKVHTRAFHDIRSLQRSILHQCEIAQLEGKAKSRNIAKILGTGEKSRISIVRYLRDVESDVYAPTQTMHRVSDRRLN